MTLVIIPTQLPTELDLRIEIAEKAIKAFQEQAKITTQALNTAEDLRIEAFKAIKKARKNGLEIRRMGRLEDKLTREYASVIMSFSPLADFYGD